MWIKVIQLCENVILFPGRRFGEVGFDQVWSVLGSVDVLGVEIV
jgi:hypothetical protein